MADAQFNTDKARSFESPRPQPLLRLALASLRQMPRAGQQMPRCRVWYKIQQLTRGNRVYVTAPKTTNAAFSSLPRAGDVSGCEQQLHPCWRVTWVSCPCTCYSVNGFYALV